EVPALDAGLFFVSYQRNPRLAFIPMFDKLSRHDALRHFTIHTGSAIAAIPPAASAPGDWVGRELLES
ncbi:MAG: deferrochelatase/peroxidase EfeB, partial [Acidimicrobiales bacterium]